jgi:ABC-type nitrate/sulfonate/bicarbonate transport system permease component
MRRTAAGRGWLLGALAVWQLAAVLASSSLFPAPTDLVAVVRSHGIGVVLRPAATTAGEAAVGFVIGNAVAFALALGSVRFRRLEPLAMQLAVLTYTVPVIALGAVMTTLWSAFAVRVAIAATYVVFTTTVGTAVGLRAADAASLDVVAAAGGSVRRQFTLVRVPAGVPSIVAALRTAAPSAVLGAIVAEYLGGEGGLGVAMVGAQRSGAVDRTWALAATGAVLAGAGFWAIGVVGRRWTARAPLVGIPRAPAMAVSNRVWGRVVGVAGRALGGALVVIVGWYAVVGVVGADRFVARTPLDVWRYLVEGDAAAHRHELWVALATTLGHAGVGFVAGTVAGAGLAVACSALPRLERLVLPPAVAAQAVPVVAFLPVGLVLLGRDVALVAVVAGLVSFFPALVNVDAALRRTPRAAVDVLAASGASRWRQITLARLPYATPALFAAARIAVPASVAGALLVEWMALGDGMGDLVLGASTRFRYDLMWTGVVVVSAATIAVASLARAGERLVAARLHLPSSVA